MRVYLETLGCRLNHSEIETLGRQLTAMGHQVVPTPEAADVCVLNTCAVTGEAARKSRQLARRLARANPLAWLAVTGCYATLAPEEVSHLPNVELVVENRRKETLAELLQPWSAELDAASWRRLAPEAPLHQFSRTRAFVKVQDGCNNQCAFCIVTVARGEERSRRLGDVVAEIQQLAAKGYQEAVLTGVHLGGYGRDLETSLHQLVAAILEQTDVPRLRLSSLEPWDMQPEFFDLWPASDGRLCPHLHLPLQAGCDRTLRRMARRSRVDSFRGLVEQARGRIPGLTVTTDIIAGFPGETVADFEESLRFVEEMDFGHVHVFPYSARAGTAAAGFGGQVPAVERRARVDAIAAAARRSAETVRRRFLDTARPVLWEEQQPDLASASTTWSGFTDNYLRVQASMPAGVDLANRITPARLTKLSDGLLLAEVALSAGGTGEDRWPQPVAAQGTGSPSTWTATPA